MEVSGFPTSSDIYLEVEKGGRGAELYGQSQ